MSGRVAVARRISLLEGFEVICDGEPVHLPLSAQRVLAFLALQSRPVQRLYVAGSLWLEVNEQRANASLRTAVWRLAKTVSHFVEATPTHLALANDVEVDVVDARRMAESAIAGANSRDLDHSDMLCRAGEILPDWYEDWVLIEREHFRQLRLHALESICEQLTVTGRFAEAIESGAAAVKAEPLRESGQRVLIKAFLAEGNQVEALRQYERYRELLDRQLGLEPSPMMNDLIEAVRSVTRP